MSFTRRFTRPKSVSLKSESTLYTNQLYEYYHPLLSIGGLSAAAVLFLAKNKYINSKRF